MATNLSDYLSEEEWGNTLFSGQFCDQLLRRIVGIDEVVQKFIDSNTTSEKEKKSLMGKKVADEKFKHLINIITRYCNRNDLQVFKTFIGVLESTKNEELAKQLTLIYNERVNSIGILNRLSKEKSLVENLKDEIMRLQQALELKDNLLKSLENEKTMLVADLKKLVSEQNENYRKEKQRLEKEIKSKEEYINVVSREREQLVVTKCELENDVENKSVVIKKREKEIEVKELQLQDAIEESNRLRKEIEKHKIYYSNVVGIEKDQMSKKIESLEDEIAAKESEILDLRRKQTMTRGEIEDEFEKLARGYKRQMDEQAILFRQQNERIAMLTSAVLQLANVVEKKE